MSKKALNVQDDSRRKGIQGNTSKSEIKCVCLNARSIINKKTELNIMVDDIKPHIIGITESWANNDITNAELGLEGYVMFRKDRIGRRGGVLLYIKDTIPAYEVQLQEEADCNDAIWCNLVTGHTTVIIGVVYRCPNITKQNNEKIHNAINEVSKGDCIIMGDFNHGSIKWDTLQSTGVEDSTFLCLVQDNFLTQHVLEHTGKDQDYVVYKEALNAATNEVRKSKRNFELKLAQNIKSDSKSFYAYVRSKQNVRDKVGPLEDNAGDKITEGILMAEELNMHFSSVFTREDTSSLPVPETKFNGSEEERLGQLIVTPEVVASKINNMKENKSPGVDGLSPKILKETVEQISKPLAHVFKGTCNPAVKML